MKITVITYNVALRLCNEKIVKIFLQPILISENTSDVVAIGLQEVVQTETMGRPEVSWLANIEKWMKINMGMKLLANNNQATNQLLIFGSDDFRNTVTRIEYRNAITTIPLVNGQKGSVAARVEIKGSTSIVFINSHLMYGESEFDYERRVFEYHANLNCTFPNNDTIRSVFWFGDFNFRVIESKDIVMRKIDIGRFSDLLDNEREQLKKAQTEGRAFEEFCEQEIDFEPTYRLKRGTIKHDERRTPSWCDRVLYKGDDIQPISYGSNTTCLTSDHLPVFAEFVLKL